MNRLRLLTADDLGRALPMKEAIAAMKSAFAAYSAGGADVPLRTRLTHPDGEAVTLIMPALVADTSDLALKVVSVVPRNPSAGLPTIHALVVVLEVETGRPSGLIEGARLTALRTGAASGAATDLLARPESGVLAVFGSGVQARTQAEAVCAVRLIKEIRIFSLDPPGAARMAEELRAAELAPTVRVAASSDDAVDGADVICTATTSSKPVFRDALIRPGTHLNAIGAFTPQMAEVDPETVARAVIIVDSRIAARAEAGDLLQAIAAGKLAPEAIDVELGEVIAGTRSGRTDPAQITLFKSVGLAVQDAVAAGAALRRAESGGIGRIVDV